MILVKITGGVGNQLFQYATGYALAKKLDCELVLDTSFYPTQTLRKYELDKFNVDARLATEDEVKSHGGGNDFVSKLLRKTGISWLIYPHYFKETESTVYHRKIEQCKVGTLLDGYWQNPRYFSEYKADIVRQFTPIEGISMPARDWQAKIEQEETKAVSLHVRRGDYVQNAHTNSVHGTCDIDYYNKAIAVMQEKLGQDVVFYVFSDDISWCKGSLNHIEHIQFVDDTTSAIDDMFLMSRCAGNIIANSTFSWWGAWLNTNGLTLAPTDWFMDKNRKYSGIYPSLWITL